MISQDVREEIRAIATGKYGGAPVFMTRASTTVPGAEVCAGDTVVYARAAPQEGQVVAVEREGRVDFARWDPGGGERIKGVVVTVIHELGR